LVRTLSLKKIIVANYSGNKIITFANRGDIEQVSMVLLFWDAK